MKFLCYRSEDAEDLGGWMRYHCYRPLQDIVQDYYSEPSQIMLHATYKHGGKTKDLPKFMLSKLKMFVTWMSKVKTYISNGGELTHWDFINRRKQDFTHYHVHGDHGSGFTLTMCIIAANFCLLMYSEKSTPLAKTSG